MIGKIENVALQNRITAIEITENEIKKDSTLKMLEGYEPVFNATVVERLKQAGVKINGLDTGSGTAETPLALAADTGGEIRELCSSLGLTGIKPSYGAVSRHGLMALASSMDQIGPIGKNIEDCAALLSIISGADGKDSTCVLEKPFDFNYGNAEKFDNLKIGLPGNLCENNAFEDAITCIKTCAKEFEQGTYKSASIEEFDMQNITRGLGLKKEIPALFDYVIPAFNIIAFAEISSNFACFDGLKYGYRSANAKNLSEVYRLSRSEAFDWETKKRIMLGSFFLSSQNYNAYFRKALQIRTLVKNAFKNLLERFDILLFPITQTFNVSVNLAGLPAVVLPCGSDNKGQAFGCQLVGKAFSEQRLVQAARVFQNCTECHTKESGAKK